MTNHKDAGAFYETDAEVESLLRRFETCAVPPSDFKHRQHLTVALLYLLRFPALEAHARMRASLLRLLKHHRIEAPVYHETLTVFWLRRVRAFIDGAGASRPVHELANELATVCADSRLVFDYYSKELIDSEGARARWVEPDLKALDF
jgi:hypothetical protein